MHKEEKMLIGGYENLIGFYPHLTTIEHFRDQFGSFKAFALSIYDLLGLIFRLKII